MVNESDIRSVSDIKSVEEEIVNKKISSEERKASDINWKEIILTRKDFEELSARLDVEPTVVKSDEVENKFGWIFPLIFVFLYITILFRDVLNISDDMQIVIKIVMFMVAYYYVSTDKTLMKSGISYTLQLILAACFATLLVAASSVV
jgi:hypothetical protein